MGGKKAFMDFLAQVALSTNCAAEVVVSGKTQDRADRDQWPKIRRKSVYTNAPHRSPPSPTLVLLSIPTLTIIPKETPILSF